MKRVRQSEAGFTIIEITVSIIVLGIMIIGIANLMPSLIQVNSRAKQISLASGAAQNKIEGLRNVGYDQIAASEDFSAELPAGLPEPRSASYATVDNGQNKEVTVTITYRGGNGTVIVSEVAIISDHGLASQ